MSAKNIIYDDEARQKLKAGIDKLSKAVVTTLGPKGKNVSMARSWGAPQVVHDGVTVAKEVELKDPFENMGAQLVKEAATKTNDIAGDGTTTATLLTQAIVEEGLRNISAGANPMILRRGLEKALIKVVEKIGDLAVKISTREERAQVATISAQDETIGNIIAEAMEKVGDDGVLTVGESKGLEMELEYKEGMQFDKGYSSPYFVTDSEKMIAEITDPYILVTDQKVTNIQELLPMLENLVKVSKNLVILSEGIEGEALATLVVNKLRGTFNALAVEAPGFGDRRKAMLEDIAALTGASLISADTGRKLDSVTVEDLGRAEKVVATKDETTVVGGQGAKEKIDARISQIKAQLDASDSEYDKDKLKERMAKLSGGVAVINVGAATETELKEKKFRVEDAVNATRAAVEEGIVPGGGVAFLRARDGIKDLKLEGDEQTGANILFAALDRPIRKLIENAGRDSGEVLAGMKVLAEKPGYKGKKENVGFNVMSLEYGDMISQGIIDPAKVTRSALQNAVSVAIMVLTTDCLIAEEPKKDEPIGGGMGGGMGGMPDMM
jgi:chaperonin GroEL